MKRIFITALLGAALCCFLAVSPAMADAGKAKFGTGVTKDWKLVNEGTEFDTNLIACAFYCTKPIGAMTAAISIYRTDSHTQSLLARVAVDVNPDWGILVLPELPLPAIGKYTFTLAKADGEVLAAGDVAITEKKVEEEMPEKPKIDGTTVEGLFNKFKPKN